MKNLGKYLFIIPMGVFGLMHMAMGGNMTGMVPSWLPYPIAFVYLVGLGLIAATVALIINKKAKLAMTLLGVLLLIFVFTIHLGGLMSDDQMVMQMSMSNLLKDTALAGAAFYLASQAED